MISASHAICRMVDNGNGVPSESSHTDRRGARLKSGEIDQHVQLHDRLAAAATAAINDST